MRSRAPQQSPRSFACANALRKSLFTALLTATVALTGHSVEARVLGLERISITVTDLDRTEAFYRDGLGFRTVARESVDDPAIRRLLAVSKVARTLTMQLGHEQVEFVQYDAPGRSYPVDSKSTDLWFQHLAVVVPDMDSAYARLQRVRYDAISTDGPQTLPVEDGGVRAFKFRDPDGHPLEFLYFPPGQGRAHWAKNESGSALGIDHTAICASNSSASIAFYRSLLGMEIAYQVVNRGSTQERLDGTPGAEVRITGLRTASPEGPGIELLDYRSPSTGRRAPPDTKADDVWHVRVVLRVDGLEETVAALHRAGVRFVFPEIVTLVDGTRAAEIVDPDGHSLMIEQ